MVNQKQKIVVVGGGHAGIALCTELVALGLGGATHLICGESRLPYHRPPLSKTYLKDVNEGIQFHRAPNWFEEAGVTLHLGDPVVTIDKNSKTVALSSGEQISYDWLVLATGTTPRVLPSLPLSLENVAVLRSAEDAERLRALFPTIDHLTVLGGGFIGLELAATAQSLGKHVTVLDMAPRLLSRSVSRDLSDYVLSTHLEAGVDIRLGVSVDDMEVKSGRLVSLTVSGEPVSVELLVVGIGAVPNIDIAEAAGLVCGNGVIVDEHMLTSDTSILAIGDVASFPYQKSGELHRLESVQNANDQARTALATILGKPSRYDALPWFWSDQGSIRLQMAGLIPSNSSVYKRQGNKDTSFSLLHYVDDRLVCVESVNAPADHLAARKLLEAKISLPPELLVNPEKPLRQFA